MDKITHRVTQLRAFKGWGALSDALYRSSMYQTDAFCPDRGLCEDGFL